MRVWGAGLLENEVGDVLRQEWLALAPRPGEHPLQCYVNASHRWTRAWRKEESGGNPQAWIALAVLQASIEYLEDDVSLEVLSAIDRGAGSDGIPAVDPAFLNRRNERLATLRELLARSLADEGTEADLEQIAALGRDNPSA